jgi:hypothetical protein
MWSRRSAVSRVSGLAAAALESARTPHQEPSSSPSGGVAIDNDWRIAQTTTHDPDFAITGVGKRAQAGAPEQLLRHHAARIAADPGFTVRRSGAFSRLLLLAMFPVIARSKCLRRAAIGR